MSETLIRGIPSRKRIYQGSCTKEFLKKPRRISDVLAEIKDKVDFVAKFSDFHSTGRTNRDQGRMSGRPLPTTPTTCTSNLGPVGMTLGNSPMMGNWASPRNSTPRLVFL